MRRLICVFFYAIFTATSALDEDFIEDFLEQLHDFSQKCAEEVNATPDDIAELILKKFPPSTHEGKCMIFCLQRSFNMMKADGNINRAGAIGALKPLLQADSNLYQKVLRIFIACGMRVKPVPDPCETASLLAECGKNEAEAIGVDLFI